MQARNANKVTCGNCGRSWDDKRDPAPAALCHFCHGRGYSNAELFNQREREKILFFYVHAGYGYDPKRETKRRGRYNGAKALADAETRLIDSDALLAVWETDPDIMSDDWITAEDDYNDGFSNPWATYCCTLYNAKTNEPVQHLGGCDFGRDGSPYTGDTHARVVVAELALQHIAESDGDDFLCSGCDRPEFDCSRNPCPDVIEDREDPKQFARVIYKNSDDYSGNGLLQFDAGEIPKGDRPRDDRRAVESKFWDAMPEIWADQLDGESEDERDDQLQDAITIMGILWTTDPQARLNLE